MNIGLIAARNARRYPNKIALVDANDGRRLTWKEYNSAVNRLAHAMLAHGLKKGDRIAIYSRNSLEYLQLFMAGAKTGIVVQPLNWRFAASEVVYTLNDCAPRAILVSGEYAEGYRAIAASIPSIEFVVGVGSEHRFALDYQEWIEHYPDSEPETIHEVGDDDLYFICYTGGTTGIAKGVMISHKNALTTIFNMTIAESITSRDVYLIMGQMFHIAVLLPHAYMFHGSRVIILNFEPRRTLEVIQSERITALLAIQTMLNYLIDVPGFASYDLSSVRIMGYGGGPMSSSTLQRAMKAFPGVGFIQYMGQTELSIMSAWLGPEDHVRAVTEGHAHLLTSCGREAVLCDVRIVDEHDVDAPRDGKTPGEMIVRGDNVMLGYWNMPELTADTLRGGWCHTGDIATWDADGYMYVVDRRKDMIVSGGENIYSAVVEEAVYQHPAVQECAVIGVPDAEYGERVKAVVVLRQGHTATAEEIIEICRKHLASYMKPATVDFVNEIPKTATGKMLKRALRERYWQGHARRVGGA
jgi:acyl-CoA synthetase (AMP-forming)/AMP-acid ligase II